VIRRGNNRCYLQTLQGSRGIARPRNTLTGTVQVDTRRQQLHLVPNAQRYQYATRRWPMRSGVVGWLYPHVWAPFPWCLFPRTIYKRSLGPSLDVQLVPKDALTRSAQRAQRARGLVRTEHAMVCAGRALYRRKAAAGLMQLERAPLTHAARAATRCGERVQATLPLRG
jgi:hypothetical protein